MVVLTKFNPTFLTGLSSDTKPTTSLNTNRHDSQLFYETDTGKLYLWSTGSSTWNEFVQKDQNRHYGYFVIQQSAIGEGPINGLVASTIGTGASITYVTGTSGASSYKRLSSGTVAGQLAGIRITTANYPRQVSPRLDVKFRTEDLTSTGARCYIAYSSTGGVPAGGADPLSALHGIGLFFDPAVSANYRIIHNNATTSVIDDFTTPIVADALDHRLSIIGAANKYTVILDNTVQDFGSVIPAAGQALAIQIYCETLSGAVSKNLRIYSAEISSD